MLDKTDAHQEFIRLHLVLMPIEKQMIRKHPLLLYFGDGFLKKQFNTELPLFF
jgi:hypothetical protein